MLSLRCACVIFLYFVDLDTFGNAESPGTGQHCVWLWCSLWWDPEPEAGKNQKSPARRWQKGNPDMFVTCHTILSSTRVFTQSFCRKITKTQFWFLFARNVATHVPLCLVFVIGLVLLLPPHTSHQFYLVTSLFPLNFLNSLGISTS